MSTSRSTPPGTSGADELVRTLTPDGGVSVRAIVGSELARLASEQEEVA